MSAALAAFRASYALDRLRLELEHGTHTAVDAAGYRLTESERRYRTQWLDTVRGLLGKTTAVAERTMLVYGLGASLLISSWFWVPSVGISNRASRHFSTFLGC